MNTLLLFVLLWLFSCFLIFLIKLILWLKFSTYQRQAEDMGEQGPYPKSSTLHRTPYCISPSFTAHCLIPGSLPPTTPWHPFLSFPPHVGHHSLTLSPLCHLSLHSMEFFLRGLLTHSPYNTPALPLHLPPPQCRTHCGWVSVLP